MKRLLDFTNYTVAWIAVLPIEAEAAICALDVRHDGHFPCVRGDDYIYIGGEINGHNVVVATLPEGQLYGTNSAAALGSHVKARFPNIWFALLVGVCAGLPNVSSTSSATVRDIRLGDVLVSIPNKTDTGIVQYDLGSDTDEGFSINGRQAEPPALVRAAIGHIRLTEASPFREGNQFATFLAELQNRARDDKFLYPIHKEDCLFEETADGTRPIHRPPRDESERTHVWYGNIGSGNSLMRNSARRDQLRDEFNLIGLEMEAAGLMNMLPTGVIRGVCDYGDSHKNKDWQPYAAATAATYAKGLLHAIHCEQADTHSQANATIIVNSRKTDGNVICSVGEDGNMTGEISTELFILLRVLQFLKTSYHDPESNFDMAAVPTATIEFFRSRYVQFSHVTSVCLAMFFKELLQLFGAHLILFLHILQQCRSLPKLLVRAHIVFEDVLGEEIFLPYRKYHHWAQFNDFLHQRFLDRQGQQYVTRGAYRLYDYEGSVVSKEQWHKIVPNSKVNMSIVIQRHERDICGRCFRVEGTSGSGTVKCSNCGLAYSKMGAWKGMDKDRVRPTVSPNMKSSEPPPRMPDHNDQTLDTEWDIEAILGYEEEMEHFTRVDFEVTMKTEPISSVVIYIGKLMKFGFYFLEQNSHRLQSSPDQLSLIQRLFRLSHKENETLINDGYLQKLDRGLCIAGEHPKFPEYPKHTGLSAISIYGNVSRIPT